MSASHGRYAGLDVMRFIAAWSVMVFHLGFWSWANPKTAGGQILQDAVSYPWLTQFAWFGGIGVETFFVISGFVISYSASQNTAMRFFRGRVLRLFPGALVCATISLVVLLWDGTFSASSLLTGYVRSITFIPLRPWIDNVYWTLGIELAFYSFVFAHLLIGAFRWFEVSITLLGIWSCVAIGLGLSGNELGQYLIQVRYGHLALAAHGVYFALGALIWIAFDRGLNVRRAATMGVFAVAGLAPIAAGALKTALQFPHLGLTEWSAIVPCLFWLSTVGAIVLTIRYDRPLPKWGPRIAILGLATYPLYLIHYRVGAVLLKWIAGHGVEQNLALGLTFGAMIALAVFITVYPERLVRNAIAPLFSGPLFRHPVPTAA